MTEISLFSTNFMCCDLKTHVHGMSKVLVLANRWDPGDHEFLTCSVTVATRSCGSFVSTAFNPIFSVAQHVGEV